MRKHNNAKEGKTTMSKTKIAIACQGGGSQTAFTAGVLKTFSRRISQSGKSATSVCSDYLLPAGVRGGALGVSIWPR